MIKRYYYFTIIYISLYYYYIDISLVLLIYVLPLYLKYTVTWDDKDYIDREVSYP